MVYKSLRALSERIFKFFAQKNFSSRPNKNDEDGTAILEFSIFMIWLDLDLNPLLQVFIATSFYKSFIATR